MANEFDVSALYQNAMEEIRNIDERLDSVTDAKGAGKRAHVNQLVATQQAQADGIVAQLSSKLEDQEPTVVVGLITALLRSLKSTFDERINTYVEAWAKENASDDTPAATIPDAEIKEMEAQRSELYKSVNSLRDIAVQFGIVDESEVDVKMPKARKRTGSRGARGPQVWSVYNYSVNGTEVDAETSLTDVAKAHGFENRKALTNFIAEKMGADWKPGNDFEVTLEDGAVVSGDYPSEVPVNDPDTVDQDATDPE